MNKNIKKLNSTDFERVFGEKLSDYVKGKIKEYDFSYYELSDEEKDFCILSTVKTLLDPNLVSAGKKRIDDWNKGWGENLKEFDSSNMIESTIPKYFDKYNIVRFEQRFIKTCSEHFEYYSLKIILDWIFEKYFMDIKSIYEFGCGTGHNLIQLSNINPNANLCGLDWARSSVELINNYAKKHDNKRLTSKKFDFFSPDYSIELGLNSGVYTIAALEQIGENYKEYITYLLKQDIEYCIHVEPIGELLDDGNLLDWLSIQYFKKRKYLKGFYKYLLQLENEGLLDIINVQRTYIGSLYIDGYSLIIWKPK
jgi:SAM-dependent methyltransferase